MSMYIQYNPNNPIHRRLPLYEMITVKSDDGIVGTSYRRVHNFSREEVDKTPWYYVVSMLQESQT